MVGPWWPIDSCKSFLRPQKKKKKKEPSEIRDVNGGHLYVRVSALLHQSYRVWIRNSCVWAARLVLALGAEPKLDLVPGAMEYALPFSTLEDALVSILWWKVIDLLATSSVKMQLFCEFHWMTTFFLFSHNSESQWSA